MTYLANCDIIFATFKVEETIVMQCNTFLGGSENMGAIEVKVFPLEFSGFKITKRGQTIKIQLIARISTGWGYESWTTTPPVQEMHLRDSKYEVIAEGVYYWLKLSPEKEKEKKQNAYIYLLEKYFNEKMTVDEIWQLEGFTHYDNPNEHYWFI